MKSVFTLALAFTTLLGSAANAGYDAKDLYTVDFSATLGGCLKEAKPESFTMHFGPRTGKGECVDNVQLHCTTRYTHALMSMGALNALDAAAASPAICSGKGPCTEVQLSFTHDKASHEDMVKLTTFEIRRGKELPARERLLKVADLLEQPRRYVVAFGACEHSVLQFKISRRR